MSDYATLAHLLRNLADQEESAAAARANLYVHLSEIAEAGESHTVAQMALPILAGSSSAAAAAAAAASAPASLISGGKQEKKTKRGTKRTSPASKVAKQSSPSQKSRVATTVTERVWRWLWGELTAWRQKNNKRSWLVLRSSPVNRKAAFNSKHGDALKELEVQRLQIEESACMVMLPTFEEPNHTLLKLHVRAPLLTNINPTIVQLKTLTRLDLVGCKRTIDISVLYELKTLKHLFLESATRHVLTCLPKFPVLRYFGCNYMIDGENSCIPCYRPYQCPRMILDIESLLQNMFLEYIHDVDIRYRQVAGYESATLYTEDGPSSIMVENTRLTIAKSADVLACRFVSRALKMGFCQDVGCVPQVVINHILVMAFPDLSIMDDTKEMRALRSENLLKPVHV